MSTLNLQKALKYKGIPDFTELNQNFSDVDGITYGADYTIMIEEKFIFNSAEDQVKNRMIKFANQCMLPTLILFTQNPKDIGNLPAEKKVINLNESKVVDFYCNKPGFVWIDGGDERPMMSFKGSKGINWFSDKFIDWVNTGCINPQEMNL